MSLLELSVAVDDFHKGFETKVAKQQLSRGGKRGPGAFLSESELMTIVIHFHQVGYRDFKRNYQNHVCKHSVNEFPKLVSYERFVELMASVLLPLIAYVQSRYRECTGISFVDNTAVAVCHNRRIARHKVFKDLVARGKTSVDWL